MRSVFQILVELCITSCYRRVIDLKKNHQRRNIFQIINDSSHSYVEAEEDDEKILDAVETTPTRSLVI